MEKKIRNNMLVISVLVVLITYICSGISLYWSMMASLDREVKGIASQISLMVKEDAESFVQMNVFSESRITLIEPDGTVIYDSIKDSLTLENHLDRPEIQKAFEKGEGRSLRFSSSQDTQTYYYAMVLSNGLCLRIASETHSLNAVFRSGLFVTTIAVLLVLIGAVQFSRKFTQKIIQPINQIDFDHPKDNKVYPELEPLLENLERHEAMRKEFSANVSHELKTPLTSISGYAEIMANGLVKDEDIPVFAQKIYDESRNLFHKIEDIIKISRLDESKLPFQLEDVNFRAVIESVLDHLEPQIEKRNINVHLELTDVIGKGIVSVTEEILYNLIENAVKYNKADGLLTVRLSQNVHFIHIEVEDTGIGISEEDLPRIYERFYRSDKSHSHQIEGSGLGLSIVKHGLFLLNGEIKVESTLHQGTKFTIDLKKHA